MGFLLPLLSGGDAALRRREGPESRAMARDSEMLMTPSISPFRRAKRELEGEDASAVFFRVSPIAERSYGGCRRA
jgi:hypothetical protein